jgi:hypothetical protein
MQESVSSVINTSRMEDEVSRLRLLLGGLRDEMYRMVWDGLEVDKASYDRETDRLLYGVSDER